MTNKKRPGIHGPILLAIFAGTATLALAVAGHLAVRQANGILDLRDSIELPMWALLILGSFTLTLLGVDTYDKRRGPSRRRNSDLARRHNSDPAEVPAKAEAGDVIAAWRWARLAELQESIIRPSQIANYPRGSTRQEINDARRKTATRLTDEANAVLKPYNGVIGNAHVIIRATHDGQTWTTEDDLKVKRALNKIAP